VVSVNLEGRRVLVTGASSGIGVEICRSIVACGGSVAMLARRKARLDALGAELGQRAHAFKADVTDLDGLQGAIADAARSLGGLDGVIANAGRAAVGTIPTGDPKLWRELFDLNIVGPLATIRYALEHFPNAGRRDAVIVGSAAALTPLPGVGVYAASKRALRGAFEALRMELAPAGINATLISPGSFFDSEQEHISKVMFNGQHMDSGAQIDVPGGQSAQTPAYLADMIAFAISRPEGVCMHEIIARPTGNLRP
jgi:NADP-dependent 3-hydroxy acid dehydrogenase YdfG